MVVWNDIRWVSKTPIIAMFLLEGANVGQLWKMWHVHSALGQNVWSWLSVNVALWLFWNYYRVVVPKETRKFAMWSTVVGICLNGAVCFTVRWFT